MEVQHAKVILAIVEEGSMVGAAEALGVTQPAISAALGQFERELGILIFHRSRKGLQLTERGKSILPAVRSFLDSEKEILGHFHVQSKTQGPLRIAGRQGFMQDVFPPLLDKLRKTYPEISIESATSGSQSEVIEALQSGRADIAFAPSPKVKSIAAEIFHHDPIRLAVSRNHPLARKRTISKQDIARLTFCLPSKSDRLRKPIEKFLQRISAKPAVALETNDYTVMRNIIAGSMYAGFIYGHMLVNPEARKMLKPLELSQLDIWRDLTLLYRRDDLAPHGITAKELFIKESKKLLSKYAK
ncbi:MAG: LysR family transcriptional regulator [Bacteroidota bacterium]|nr:LysR family transcriptional regulator [Bacteroidota bacterium]MDP4231083.1 LysR family transcriptional regulator [Bacteroidota bacterium]MDP4236729.1 LysR family transcriptional regulator [Bacteroidota bacterium]